MSDQIQQCSGNWQANRAGNPAYAGLATRWHQPPPGCRTLCFIIKYNSIYSMELWGLYYYQLHVYDYYFLSAKNIPPSTYERILLGNLLMRLKMTLVISMRINLIQIRSHRAVRSSRRFNSIQFYRLGTSLINMKQVILVTHCRNPSMG